MPSHLLRRHLERRRVALVDPRVRNHDVEAPCHALDLLDGGLVVLLVSGDDLDDAYAAGMSFGEGVELGSVGWIARAREDDKIWPCG